MHGISPDASALFCEPVRVWFERRFAGATELQAQGWPVIASGRDALIAAPCSSPSSKLRVLGSRLSSTRACAN